MPGDENQDTREISKMMNVQKIADSIKLAFEEGKPCKLPMMTIREAEKMLALLERMTA